MTQENLNKGQGTGIYCKYCGVEKKSLNTVVFCDNPKCESNKPKSKEKTR